MQVGTYQPIFKRIDLMNGILMELIKEYQPYSDEKGLAFSIDCKVPRVFILADEYSVRQIFTNLIDNAVKFTNAGYVQVHIYQPTDELISICVEDTGIGITPEFMKNLFVPFAQEDHGYTRKFEGNGLGLTVVKKFCELNKATISVESKKGEGSKFTVSFQTHGS
jgi:signal transduction histidine kinase